MGLHVYDRVLAGSVARFWLRRGLVEVLVEEELPATTSAAVRGSWAQSYTAHSLHVA